MIDRVPAYEGDVKSAGSTIAAVIADASRQSHEDMAALQRELVEQTSRFLVWTISAVTLVTTFGAVFVKFR